MLVGDPAARLIEVMSDGIPRREFLRRSVLQSALLGSAAFVGESLRAENDPPAVAQRTRIIPSSGESISCVGMGTWQTFDVPLNPQSEAYQRMQLVLELFYKTGGRVIDSSPMYGRSEAAIGRMSADAGFNQELWMATKVWTRGRAAGREQMQQSLAKLRRRRLELMQIHNLVDWRTHMRTLRAWKDGAGDSGLDDGTTLRYIGVTHYAESAFDELERIMRSEPIDFVQLPYSLRVRAAEARLLPLARDRGIAVLVNRPYEGGALFRSFSGDAPPEFTRDFAASPGQMFLKWILAHPAVTAVLPATSKPQHLTDNMGAGLGRLPDDRERQKIVAFLR